MKVIYADAKAYRFTDSLLKISEAQLIELQGKIKILTTEQTEQKIFYEGQMNYLRNQIEIYKEQITGYETINRRLTRQLKVQKIVRNGLLLGVAAAAVKIFLIK